MQASEQREAPPVPTRAVVLSARERAWIVDKLLAAGYSQREVASCVERGEWGALRLLPIDYALLTCRSCGAKPYREASGRIKLGCSGGCQQQALADAKDRVVEDRVRRAAAAARRTDEDDEYSSPLERYGR